MSEVLIPAAEEGVGPNAQTFNSKAALRSVGVSIVVNGVLPFALYKILVPYFAPGSIMPLLYASAFPIVGLAVGFIRTRVVDAIACFALFGIVYSVVSTLLAGEIRLAMIVASTQAFLIAAFFTVSALIGKPIIFFIVRQFATGNDPQRRTQFNAVNAADNGRTCFIATLVWAVAIAALGVVSITLALTVAPATYLLVNNIVNTAVNVLLVVWTIRYVRSHLTAVGTRMAQAQ
ncbi:MAG TPA: VC0807 family protein [Rhizomicrobium sp.]|nr:VC0807 family protein [Rhizomicrobium sp.]